MKFTPFFKSFRWLILAFICLQVVTNINLINISKLQEQSIYSGVIIKKVSEFNIHRQHSYVNYFFLIKFDNYKDVKTIKVPIKDYYFKKEGNKVTYLLSGTKAFDIFENNKINPLTLYIFEFMFYCFLWIVFIIVLIVTIREYILIKNKK